jgi:hypothetical protein
VRPAAGLWRLVRTRCGVRELLVRRRHVRVSAAWAFARRGDAPTRASPSLQVL